MAVQVSLLRTIEVTILSAENLRLNGKPIKKNASVIIRYDYNNSSRTKTIDKEGGSNPKWNNEKHVIDLPMRANHFTIEVVQCKTTTSSSSYRVIGTAIVPVTDFVCGLVPEGYLHFLSYRLRDNRSQRNGIINISVRVKVPLGHSVYSNSNNTCSSSQTPVGLPIGNNSGIVTGVPFVLYSN